MNLLKQSITVSVAKFGEKLMSFGIILIASRHFASEGVGEFFYYFSLVSLLLPLMDMGFEKLLLIRWADRDGDGRRLLLGRLIALKVVFGAVALGIALLIDQVVRGAEAHPLATAAAFWATYMEGFAFLLRGPKHARNEIRLELIVPVTTRFLTLVGLLVLMGRLENGYELCLLYAVANTVGTLLSLPGLRGCIPRWPSATSRSDWGELIRSGIPFSLTSLFVMISLSIDSVILARYDMAATGEYNAAYRVILVVIVLSGGACHALFPRISGLRMGGAKGLEEAAGLFRSVGVAYLMFFGAIAIGGFITGPQIMRALYGADFTQSGLAFQVLCPLVLLASLTNLTGQTMEALGRQNAVMKLNLVSCAFNFVMNLIFIPKYGLIAAAGTTIATEFLTFLLMLRLLHQASGATSLQPRGLWKAVLFLVTLSLAYLPLPYLSIWLAIPLGGLIFGGLLLGGRRFWLSGLAALPTDAAAPAPEGAEILDEAADDAFGSATMTADVGFDPGALDTRNLTRPRLDDL